MKGRVFRLLIVASLCGLWGCASSKPVQTQAADIQSAVDPNPLQPPAAAAKPRQVPAKNLAPASKPAAVPVDVAKVKSNNDVAPQQKALAPKEAAVAPIDAHGKPVEMKVANGFDKNPYLASVVKPLVPPRSTLTQTAMGFKNERQFITALHLSRNLVIPFDQIKIRITGDHRMSLSDSLRDIRPSISKSMAKDEVKKAEQQAKDDESHAKEQAKKAAAKEKLANSGKSDVAGNLSSASSRR
jgi:hypothetical protein